MMKRLIFAVFSWFLIGQGMAVAADLAKEKARYAVADKLLNGVFAELKKALPAERFEEMRKDQREWVDYKTYMCDWVGGEEGRATAEWWEMAAGLTESRVDYLKAWKGVGEDFAWAGVYQDGRGGFLYIEKRGGKLHFAVEVVRGPTYHLGNLSGVMEVNGGRGRFSDGGGDEPDPEVGEAWLDFKQIDGQRIEVEATNAQQYHGARAYFDGVYLRVDAKGVIPKEEE
jgi:hypothetical protein